MEFKVGDKVRILSRATMVGVEREDVGKVGVVASISEYPTERFGIIVKMNDVCKARGCIPTWSVGSTMIALTHKKNEQFVFNFMIQ